MPPLGVSGQIVRLAFQSSRARGLRRGLQPKFKLTHKQHITMLENAKL